MSLKNKNVIVVSTKIFFKYDDISKNSNLTPLPCPYYSLKLQDIYYTPTTGKVTRPVF